LIKRYFIPAILWFIISTILLTLPGSSLPKEQWLDNIPWFDKWVHIGMFAIMVVLWDWALKKKYPDPTKLKTIFLWVAVSALAYGIGMEFVQGGFIPGRSCDIKDMLADAAGCGVGLVYSISRYIKK
jgi:VanZ family protein